MMNVDDGPCGVCIDGDEDGDSPRFHRVEHLTSRKTHRCCECGDVIPIGARYERVTGKWEDAIDVFKTCAACEDVRNNLCCDGWTYTQLWENAQNSGIFERLTTGCLDQLATAAGKAKLLAAWRDWKFDEQPTSVDTVDPSAQPSGTRTPRETKGT